MIVNNRLAKIYKIYDNTNGNVYYGSTIQRLSRRKAHHKEAYKKYLNGNFHYCTAFQILENNDYNVSLVEEFEYNNKEEMIARERYYIENYQCVNKCIPGRTMKEYREDNKESILIKQKEYRENNKELIAEKKREKIICPICGIMTNKYKLSRHQKSKKCKSNIEI
tara:strand:+ start:662 stop:1159 length:498 start_codon:yes stop_codon:yes gene_type:complete